MAGRVDPHLLAIDGLLPVDHAGGGLRPGERLEKLDPVTSRRIVLDMFNDPADVRTLREVAVKLAPGATARRDEDTLAYIIGALATGRLQVVASEPRRQPLMGAPTSKPDEPIELESSGGMAQTHWCEVQLVDESGRGVPAQRCIIVAPDGQEHHRYTDTLGFVRVTRIVDGLCLVAFPDIDAKVWRSV